ncbi:MAG: GNAT family N-acetyltransferase [Ruminococcus sp.]|nr:GNAT family N-acetyltransferase [Ruminococcus sp.]
MKLLKGDISYLDILAEIESTCFPAEQAADKHQLRRRLEVFPGYFFLLCDDNGRVISFINGFVTDLPDLTDEMYNTPEMHDENGSWQMIFGLNTLPGFRRRGHAAALMNEFLSNARAQGRRGAVLTCKQQLVPYYEKFGFVNEGVTDKSVIGGVEWYQMRRSF